MHLIQKKEEKNKIISQLQEETKALKDELTIKESEHTKFEKNH